MHRTQLVIRVGREFAAIGRAIQLQRGSKEVCITPALDKVMVIIGFEKRVNIKDIAHVLSISSGAATQHVEALEKLGNVERHANPNDKREIFVTLTPEGKKAYQNIMRARRELLSEVFSPLSDEELAQFAALITKIKDNYGQENPSL
jgi:DNA-binding MarR family transcriptional regulator